jgi:hypothetical protein
MSDNDYDNIKRSAGALRSVLRKNSAKLKRDPAGKEVIETAEQFVTDVEIFTQVRKSVIVDTAANIYMDTDWTHHAKPLFAFSFRSIHETLAFRNVPLVIGGGTLGMIIGEKIVGISSTVQWVLIAVGLLIGLGVASLKSDVSAADQS